MRYHDLTERQHALLFQYRHFGAGAGRLTADRIAEWYVAGKITLQELEDGLEVVLLRDDLYCVNRAEPGAPPREQRSRPAWGDESPRHRRLWAHLDDDYRIVRNVREWFTHTRRRSSRVS